MGWGGMGVRGGVVVAGGHGVWQGGQFEGPLCLSYSVAGARGGCVVQQEGGVGAGSHSWWWRLGGMCVMGDLCEGTKQLARA